MRKESFDAEVEKNFPGAKYIDRGESLVFKYQNKAINVYPINYPERGLREFVESQNNLSNIVRSRKLSFQVDTYNIPILINQYDYVKTFPSGRVYISSPFNSDPNLLNLNPRSLLIPPWFTASISEFGWYGITEKLNNIFYKELRVENIPPVFQLASRNIHIGRNKITIVHIASHLQNFVNSFSAKN